MPRMTNPGVAGGLEEPSVAATYERAECSRSHTATDSSLFSSPGRLIVNRHAPSMFVLVSVLRSIHGHHRPVIWLV